MNNKLSFKKWISFIVIGLVGQFAWSIENMYFNVYLYNTISTDPAYIALMVALSAVTAALTTLFMGSLSDKIGKRKIFICLGYVLWGISTLSFGFINTENIAKLFPMSNAIAVAAIGVVVMDCVMTFFGSSANDAAFNAYITDVTDNTNRAKVESVLSTLPLISMLVIFGLFDGFTQRGQWREFFMIFGMMVIIAGFLSIVLVDDGCKIKKEQKYFSQIIYGFRPNVIKEHKMLYVALTAFCFFSISIQVFFPYLIIYIQNYLKIDNYAIILGIVLIVASVVSVIMGGRIDKIGKMKCVFPSIACFVAGLVLMYIARENVFIVIAGCVMMSGYMIVNTILSAVVRDLTPVDKVGAFQGIRMIFAVMIPMVAGPTLGARVIKNSAETYVELGVVKNVPTPDIFTAAALVALISLIPLFILKKQKKEKCK